MRSWVLRRHLIRKVHDLTDGRGGLDYAGGMETLLAVKKRTEILKELEESKKGSLSRSVCVSAASALYRSPEWEKLLGSEKLNEEPAMDLAKIEVASSADDKKLLRESLRKISESNSIDPNSDAVDVVATALLQDLKRNSIDKTSHNPWFNEASSDLSNLDKHLASLDMDPKKVLAAFKSDLMSVLSTRALCNSTKFDVALRVTAKYHPDNVRESLALLETKMDCGGNVSVEELDVVWETIAGCGDWQAGIALKAKLDSYDVEMTEDQRAKLLDACGTAKDSFALHYVDRLLKEQLGDELPSGTYQRSLILATAQCDGLSTGRSLAASSVEKYCGRDDSGKILEAMIAIEDDPEIACSVFETFRSSCKVTGRNLIVYVTALHKANDDAGLRAILKEMRPRDGEVTITDVEDGRVSHAAILATAALNKNLFFNPIKLLETYKETKDKETRAIVFRAASMCGPNEVFETEKLISRIPERMRFEVLLSILPLLDKLQPGATCYSIISNFAKERHPLLYNASVTRSLLAQLHQDTSTDAAPLKNLMKSVNIASLSGFERRMFVTVIHKISFAKKRLFPAENGKFTGRLLSWMNRSTELRSFFGGLLEECRTAEQVDSEYFKIVLQTMLRVDFARSPECLFMLVSIPAPSPGSARWKYGPMVDKLCADLSAENPLHADAKGICDALLLKKLLDINLSICRTCFPPDRRNVATYVDHFLKSNNVQKAKEIAQLVAKNAGEGYQLPSFLVERLKFAEEAVAAKQEAGKTNTEVEKSNFDVHLPTQCYKALEKFRKEAYGDLEGVIANMIFIGADLTTQTMIEKIRECALHGEGNELLWYLAAYLENSN